MNTAIGSAVAWATPYVGTIFVSLAALFAFLQTPFGAKIFDATFKHYFDQKLADLKHDQDRKLADVKHVYERNVEELRADLSHFADRGKHSNEREYQALIAAWESFVAAYYATLACVDTYFTHPDLDRMGDDELDEYLQGTDIEPPGRRFIKTATNKNAALGRMKMIRNQNEAQRLIWEARNTIHKQSVFIPFDIENEFEQTLSTLHKVWAESHVDLTSRGSVELKASMALLDSGDQMKAALRDIVRKRVLREALKAPDSGHA
jgi:hypothetical protein